MGRDTPVGPPTYDGKAFGAWLTRYMLINEIGVEELARRSHLSVGMITRLRTGGITSAGKARGQKNMQVTVNTLAAAAYGLGMPLSHVAKKAGIQLEGDRWEGFSPQELAGLTKLLRAPSPDDLDDRLDAFIRQVEAGPVTIHIAS